MSFPGVCSLREQLYESMRRSGSSHRKNLWSICLKSMTFKCLKCFVLLLSHSCILVFDYPVIYLDKYQPGQDVCLKLEVVMLYLCQIFVGLD